MSGKSCARDHLQRRDSGSRESEATCRPDHAPAEKRLGLSKILFRLCAEQEEHAGWTARLLHQQFDPRHGRLLRSALLRGWNASQKVGFERMQPREARVSAWVPPTAQHQGTVLKSSPTDSPQQPQPGAVHCDQQFEVVRFALWRSALANPFSPSRLSTSEFGPVVSVEPVAVNSRARAQFF